MAFKLNDNKSYIGVIVGAVFHILTSGESPILSLPPLVVASIWGLIASWTGVSFRHAIKKSGG